MEVMIIKRKTCHLTSILTKSKLSWKSIITFQNSDTWKIELTIAVNILSSKDTDKEGVNMYWIWFHLWMPRAH